ncbi:MAG: hypothetical protein QF884_08040 [Porticoccaceae bacterium]|jgi:hypothetical protein|nr:hypothetical protein [Porticoccaceae bacterium]
MKEKLINLTYIFGVLMVVAVVGVVLMHFASTGLAVPIDQLLAAKAG